MMLWQCPQHLQKGKEPSEYQTYARTVCSRGSMNKYLKLHCSRKYMSLLHSNIYSYLHISGKWLITIQAIAKRKSGVGFHKQIKHIDPHLPERSFTQILLSTWTPHLCMNPIFLTHSTSFLLSWFVCRPPPKSLIHKTSPAVFLKLHLISQSRIHEIWNIDLQIFLLNIMDLQKAWQETEMNNAQY